VTRHVLVDLDQEGLGLPPLEEATRARDHLILESVDVDLDVSGDRETRLNRYVEGHRKAALAKNRIEALQAWRMRIDRVERAFERVERLTGAEAQRLSSLKRGESEIARQYAVTRSVKPLTRMFLFKIS